MDFKNIWKHPVTTMYGIAIWAMTIAFNCYEYYELHKDTNKYVMGLGIAGIVIGSLAKDK